eukprot:g73640.t1
MYYDCKVNRSDDETCWFWEKGGNPSLRKPRPRWGAPPSSQFPGCRPPRLQCSGNVFVYAQLYCRPFPRENLSKAEMNLGLEGQHVLVTGAAGGIGVALVERLLEAKCLVSAHYHSQKTTLESLRKQHPTKLLLVQARSEVEEDVARAVRQAVERFGPIHVLVGNHGIWPPQDKRIWEMELSHWNRTLSVNLTGIFLFCREYCRQLKQALEQKKVTRESFTGGVVLVGSTAGKFGEACHADYAASKSALMYGFNRSLKNELVQLAPRARVNVVAPGWVHTLMATETIAKGGHFIALQTTPLGKVATTEEVVNAVLFLASGRASGHTTGQVLMIDGGMEGRVLNSIEDLRKSKL